MRLLSTADLPDAIDAMASRHFTTNIMMFRHVEHYERNRVAQVERLVANNEVDVGQPEQRCDSRRRQRKQTERKHTPNWPVVPMTKW